MLKFTTNGEKLIEELRRIASGIGSSIVANEAYKIAGPAFKKNLRDSLDNSPYDLDNSGQFRAAIERQQPKLKMNESGFTIGIGNLVELNKIVRPEQVVTLKTKRKTRSITFKRGLMPLWLIHEFGTGSYLESGGDEFYGDSIYHYNTSVHYPHRLSPYGVPYGTPPGHKKDIMPNWPARPNAYNAEHPGVRPTRMFRTALQLTRADILRGIQQGIEKLMRNNGGSPPPVHGSVPETGGGGGGGGHSHGSRNRGSASVKPNKNHAQESASTTQKEDVFGIEINRLSSSSDNDYIYRGVSARELQRIRQTGFVQPERKDVTTNRATHFTDNPLLAARHATWMAHPEEKPTEENPYSYVLKIRKPKEENTLYSHPSGVLQARKPIPISNVESIMQVRYTPNPKASILGSQYRIRTMSNEEINEILGRKIQNAGPVKEDIETTTKRPSRKRNPLPFPISEETRKIERINRELKKPKIYIESYSTGVRRVHWVRRQIYREEGSGKEYIKWNNQVWYVRKENETDWHYVAEYGHELDTKRNKKRKE